MAEGNSLPGGNAGLPGCVRSCGGGAGLDLPRPQAVV